MKCSICGIVIESYPYISYTNDGKDYCKNCNHLYFYIKNFFKTYKSAFSEKQWIQVLRNVEDELNG